MASHSPGDWFGVVTPAGIALLAASVPPAAVERVWRELRAGHGLAAVIDGLVGAFGASLGTLPAFAVATLAEDGDVRVAVRGNLDARLWTTGASEPTIIPGLGVTTWTERLVAGVVRAELAAPGVADGELLPLTDGIVRAGRLVLSLQASDTQPEPPVIPAPVFRPEPPVIRPGPPAIPASPAAPTPPPPTPTPARSAETVVASEVPNEYDRLLYGETVLSSVEAAAVRAEEPDPAPTPPAPTPPAPAPLPPPPSALGDHDGETVLVDQLGVRPPVGPPGVPPATPARQYPTLLVPGREPVRLDRTAIVGTRPRLSRVQVGNAPHLVSVESVDGEISRNHVELRLEGATVLAVDLNSTNGTMLLRVGSEPVRLQPGEPNILIPGDRIDLGENVVLAFEGLL